MGRFTYKNSFKPRSIRKSESKAQRKLIFNLILILVLIYVFFNWGLPFVVGSLSFLNQNKKSAVIDEVKIDEAIAPPVLFIPFESTNSATIAISGYSTPLSKVEIYFDEELKAQLQTEPDGKFKSEDLSLNLGTNNIYAVTINDKNMKSLQSKNIKVYYNNEKPTLEITEPLDSTEIKGSDRKLKVSGKTDPNNSVSINGSAAIVSNDGTFQTVIELKDGDNIITFIATNSFGNTNQFQRTIKFIPQEPSPSPNP